MKQVVFCFLASYFAVSVISGGFVELLPQREADICVFEGALGADRHLVSLLADDDGRLGHIPDLPGGKTHTWGKETGTKMILSIFFSLSCVYYCTVCIKKCSFLAVIFPQRFDSPSAFMYSSKFSLSTSFQVAQKASTMVKVCRGQSYLQNTLNKLQLLQVHSSLLSCCLLLLCTDMGGAQHLIGSGDFNWAVIGWWIGSSSLSTT